MKWYNNVDQNASIWESITITNFEGQKYKTSALSDVDDDGDIDIILAKQQGYQESAVIEFMLYKNSGGTIPTWTESTIYSEQVDVRSIAMDDIDGDGLLDIVVLGDSHYPLNDNLYWLKNNQDTLWTKHPITNYHDEVYFASAVKTHDTDNDGDVDIFTAVRMQTEDGMVEDYIVFHENNGVNPSDWNLIYIQSVGKDVTDISLADINKDGYTDIFSASSQDNKIAWYEYNSDDNSLWNGVDMDVSAYNARSILAADVDNDGDMDAISFSRDDNSLSWYENSFLSDI